MQDKPEKKAPRTLRLNARDNVIVAVDSVEPGVTVQGHVDDSVTNWIGVKQDGRIYAEGTPTRPIVFTGPTTDIGSWGGLHIAGRSTCNDYVSEAEPCRFEAYPDMAFGGDKLNDNSGVLRYVRIQSAGALTPFANQEFKQQQAECVHIGQGADGLAKDLLGRRIGR